MSRILLSGACSDALPCGGLHNPLSSQLPVGRPSCVGPRVPAQGPLSLSSLGRTPHKRSPCSGLCCCCFCVSGNKSASARFPAEGPSSPSVHGSRFDDPIRVLALQVLFREISREQSVVRCLPKALWDICLRERDPQGTLTVPSPGV